jgi:dihydroorotase
VKYDLLITDGNVLDPDAGLRGKLDIGISGGRIIEVGSSLPRNMARKVFNAGGRLVLPGLVDLHAHVLVNGYDMGPDTDRFCRCSGVTTLCDAGSTGSGNFNALRGMVDRSVRTNIRAFVNLSAIGVAGIHRCGELAYFPHADPEGCARTIIENPDLAIGVKLRFGPGLVWEYSAEPVKLARHAADMAGGVPMMMHITDSPVPLPDLISHMKPGDIVTHCYHGKNHGILDGQRKIVLQEIVEAQKAGIIFDCAHGHNHFSFATTEKALDHGFLPDTISTDLTLNAATRGPVWDLPTTMTKLLHFGLPLDEIVKRTTTAPARIMGYEGISGTLRPGADADISLFELRDEDKELMDSEGKTLITKRYFYPYATIKNGQIWYQHPID